MGDRVYDLIMASLYKKVISGLPYWYLREMGWVDGKPTLPSSASRREPTSREARPLGQCSACISQADRTAANRLFR